MTAWFIAAILLAAAGDGWSNLKRVTRDRLYAVILRDGQCQYGILSSVGEEAVVLGTDSALGVLIKRSQIARVSDNLTAPARDIVFSGRSSWLDVKAAAPGGTGYLRIVTKRRGDWKWKQPAVSDDSITLDGITVGKADVRYVFYIRSKPLTVDEEYLHQADFKWLASVPWLGDLVPGKISVRLYSSELTEDNSPIACR